MVAEKTDRTKRVNIRIPEELDDFFAKRSVSTGLSKSALMYIALEEHVKQHSVMEALPQLMARLENIEKNK